MACPFAELWRGSAEEQQGGSCPFASGAAAAPQHHAAKQHADLPEGATERGDRPPAVALRRGLASLQDLAGSGSSAAAADCGDVEGAAAGMVRSLSEPHLAGAPANSSAAAREPSGSSTTSSTITATAAPSANSGSGSSASSGSAQSPYDPAAYGTAAAAPPAAAGTALPLWRRTRPQLAHCPKLTRRQLRALDRTFTLDEVRQHRYVDDAWIAVDGKVYDITEHIVTHPGWDSASVSTVLSIVAHAGTECTLEFREIHRPYPVAWKQLRAFYIGDLAPEAEAEPAACRAVPAGAAAAAAV